jgi:hypothetical protein
MYYPGCEDWDLADEIGAIRADRERALEGAEEECGVRFDAVRRLLRLPRA